MIVSGGAEVVAGGQVGSFPRAGTQRHDVDEVRRSAEGGLASQEMVRVLEDGVASRTRSRRSIG